jgi:hypothetical protein
MLTQLPTLKSRLSIPDVDVQYDALLTNALTTMSVRFDCELNRTLARTVDATHEFASWQTELSPLCYPIESVSKFELKTTEAEGWLEQTGAQYLFRRSCIISLSQPFSFQYSAFSISVARVTYTGGYVLPGDTAAPGQTALPADLEQAAVEQAAAWFLHRDNVGLELNWPKGGVYQRFSQLPLLPSVEAVLSRYTRWAL